MNNVACERALQLAGQTELSGEVLAARWHVRHCPHCQRLLSELWTQVAVLDNRLALQKLLDIDLGDAICEEGERVITWLARGTRDLLAVLIRLGDALAPPASARQWGTLGVVFAPEYRVIRQDTEQTPDGSLAWKITFVVGSADPEQCTAEVEVNVFDRWDLSGIDVFLTWDGDQRHGQTNERGQVQFAPVPVDALGRVNVIIHPPQAPINMNGAQ